MNKNEEIKNEEIVEHKSKYFRQSNILEISLAQMDTPSMKMFYAVLVEWNKKNFIMTDSGLVPKKDSELVKSFIFNSKDFCKSVGLYLENDDVNVNTELIKNTLEKFDTKTKLVLTKKHKDQYPELFEIITKKLVEGNKEIPHDDITSANIHFFQSFTTDRGYFGVKLTEEAIPVFNAISSKYTILDLNEISKLTNNELLWYNTIKIKLGNNKEKEIRYSVSPTPTNPYNNLRYLFNCSETKRKKRIKEDGSIEVIEVYKKYATEQGKARDGDFLRITLQSLYSMCDKLKDTLSVEYLKEKEEKKGKTITAITLLVKRINKEVLDCNDDEIKLYEDSYNNLKFGWRFSRDTVYSFLNYMFNNEEFEERTKIPKEMDLQEKNKLKVDYLQFVNDYILKVYQGQKYRITNPIGYIFYLLKNGSLIYDAQTFKYDKECKIHLIEDKHGYSKGISISSEEQNDCENELVETTEHSKKLWELLKKRMDYNETHGEPLIIDEEDESDMPF